PTSVRTSRLSRMPCASPRYSPVGSRLSVKPQDPSQPTRSVPPREIVLPVLCAPLACPTEAMMARLAAATTATKPTRLILVVTLLLFELAEFGSRGDDARSLQGDRRNLTNASTHGLFAS